VATKRGGGKTGALNHEHVSIGVGKPAGRWERVLIRKSKKAPKQRNVPRTIKKR